MGRRMLGMEIIMDGEGPEEKEEAEGQPGAQHSPFHPHQESPKDQEDGEKEEEPLKRG
jgi:hypothetical protein